MSLNKTLNRLFDEVRREAKRNPAFADRLDAAIRAHASAREIDERNLDSDDSPIEPAPAPLATDLNPLALFTREGPDALRMTLAALPDETLFGLIGEHNLDPAGTAADLAGHDLVEHIVSQAEKRVERDRKMFDY